MSTELNLKIRTMSKEVLDAKTMIEQRYKHPIASQRLIYQGKVLLDGETLSSYNIDQSKMVVLYVKVRESHQMDPAAAAKTTSATTATPATTNTTTPPPTQTAPQSTTTPANPVTTPLTAPAPAPTPDAITGDPDFQKNVQTIVDMGFPRDQVIPALRAAFGNIDRAVEYLFSGNIPEEPVAPAATGTGGTGSGSGTGGAFAQLRQLPQVRTLIALIQQNPQYLEPLLQQLAERNPQFVELIRDNREEFLQMLQEPIDDANLDFGDEEEGEEEEGEPAGLGTPGAVPPRVPPGATVIQLTQAENEAVERLCALGFPRNRVIEAFLVCNKDEQLAANYLFDQGE